jgi:hypothetical protein
MKKTILFIILFCAVTLMSCQKKVSRCYIITITTPSNQCSGCYTRCWLGEEFSSTSLLACDDSIIAYCNNEQTKNYPSIYTWEVSN